MRWTIGLVLGFATVLGVNALFLYLALDNAPEIEPTYLEEAR